MTRKLTDSEVATILHALRSMQRNIEDDLNDGCNSEEGCDHFEEAAPLNAEEIDALCESINFDGLLLTVPANVASL